MGAAVTLSETVSEKRRGRPAAWHADALLDAMATAKTVRGKENWRLTLSAMGTLEAHWRPPFAWFWQLGPMPAYADVHDAVMNRGAQSRPTVLTEIGRVLLSEDRLALAEGICALLLTTTTARAAVAACRAWRLGK